MSKFYVVDSCLDVTLVSIPLVGKRFEEFLELKLVLKIRVGDVYIISPIFLTFGVDFCICLILTVDGVGGKGVNPIYIIFRLDAVHRHVCDGCPRFRVLMVEVVHHCRFFCV